MRTPRLIAAAATVAALVAGGGAAATPPSFHLVFDGRHNAALLHEGRFTSSSSLCPSGSAADISVDSTTDTALRRFTCTGGGGFTARITPLPAEHGGNGIWQIVEGAGPLTDFRGKGTFSSTRTAGRSDDPTTITFSSTWDGVADLDVLPPTVAVPSSTVHKLKRPKGSYSLRIVVTFSGDQDVSYVLQVVDPKKAGNAFVYKLAKTTTGAASLTLRIKPPRRIRTVQLKIAAEDAVGNAASFERTVRLR